MRHGLEFLPDGDYVFYWTPWTFDHQHQVTADSPSASEWMIPGTWSEDDRCS